MAKKITKEESGQLFERISSDQSFTIDISLASDEQFHDKLREISIKEINSYQNAKNYYVK